MKKVKISLFVLFVLAMNVAMALDSSVAIVRMLNSRASGSPKAFSEAVAIVAKDAADGKPLQQYVMAVLSSDTSACKELRLTKETRDKYLEASRVKIENLAKIKSNALAWYLLSLEKNDKTLLKRAAEGENVQALNAYGTLLLLEAINNINFSKEDRDKQIKLAFGCFQRAAGQKDGNGLYNLGMCYMNGYGCDKDIQTAFDSFRASAELGHPEAINNLGGFCRDGILVEKDVVRATKWFAKSAELGNVYGKFNYALAIQRGEGVEQNAKRAAEMFLEASNEGCVEALNAYGMCLLKGDGCKKDEIKAVEAFRRAAREGFPLAMDNLSECCNLGIGGCEKSAKEAVLWKVRARAARGDRNALAWLRDNGHSLY